MWLFNFGYQYYLQFIVPSHPINNLVTHILFRVESWESPGKAGGSLIKSLGDTDDINARTDAILYDLNIDFQEFSPEVGIINRQSFLSP